MSISTVLLDFGGVIQTPNDPVSVSKRREKLAGRLGFRNRNEMWLRFYAGDEWMATKTGRMTDEEMWHRLLTPHGLDTREEQLRFVRELFRGEELKDTMRHLIRQLRRQYRLAILSNASDNLEDILRDKLGIIDWFQVVVNSHRIGVAKPDLKAFRIALSMIGAEPGEVLFVDDQIRNTQAAEQLGIYTHHFTDVGGFRTFLDSEGLI